MRIGVRLAIVAGLALASARDMTHGSRRWSLIRL
jgi:hypothetical protein